MSTVDSYLVIIIMTGVTIFTRAIPFIFFRSKKPPEIICYTEKYLPPMVMVVLVVYCIKDLNFLKSPFGLPELISMAVVAGLHYWKKNALLSISSGTILYMLIVQHSIFG